MVDLPQAVFAGFGLSGYRSFAADSPKLLSPMGKVNLVVGQNNAGKSNLLRFAQHVIGDASASGQVPGLRPLKDNDHPHAKPGKTSLSVGLRLTPEEIIKLVESTQKRLTEPMKNLVHAVFRLPAFHRTNDDLIWVDYVISPRDAHYVRGSDKTHTLKIDEEWSASLYVDQPTAALEAISQVYTYLFNAHTGDRAEHMRRITESLAPLRLLPRVETIPDFRQVRSGDTSDLLTHDGAGLIARLQQLERPVPSRQEDKEKFRKIEQFVQTVLEDPLVRIEIPYDQSTISIQRHGTVLPLENHGTGIHQVVIIAAAATLIQDSLVCIEEPEIHLHPLLQRQLLRYLAEQTSNRYLIATHSAHMLDSDIASIFHVTYEDEGSSVRLASKPHDVAEICFDLGYRPSDLVQANAIIWVEGPTDRFYIKHWLNLRAPELIEGIHYSLMFYGGALLNHLSADDPEIDEFISLRRINRNIAIIIDSDRKKAGARLNQTKLRIQAEFNKGPGHAWVTKGYTIENYIPRELLESVIAKIRPDAVFKKFGQYINPLGPNAVHSSKRKDRGTWTISKVKVAHEIIPHWTEDTEWLYDLREQVDKLARFVRAANGLAESTRARD